MYCCVIAMQRGCGGPWTRGGVTSPRHHWGGCWRRQTRGPDPLAAFRIAREWFLAGRRIEMRELAAELGVNRATLFRWVGNRDDLLAEILWSLAERTLATAIDDAPGHGGQRIATAIGRFATLIDQRGVLPGFPASRTRTRTTDLDHTRRDGPVSIGHSRRNLAARRDHGRSAGSAVATTRPGIPDRADSRVLPIRRHHHRRADRHSQDRTGDCGVGEVMSPWTTFLLPLRRASRSAVGSGVAYPDDSQRVRALR